MANYVNSAASTAKADGVKPFIEGFDFSRIEFVGTITSASTKLGELCIDRSPVIVDGGVLRGETIRSFMNSYPAAKIHAFESNPMLVDGLK